MRAAEEEETPTAEGTTVLPTWDSHEAHRDGADLYELCDPADTARTPLSPETHASCPGHAAYVTTHWSWDGPARSLAAKVHYVCTAWRAHGHAERFSRAHTTPTSRAAMTDEQREAARAERRDVIQSNKAWDSAEATRREWVTRFLTRRTAPKGAAVLIAQAIASTGWTHRANVDDGKVRWPRRSASPQRPRPSGKPPRAVPSCYASDRCSQGTKPKRAGTRGGRSRRAPAST